MPAALVAASCPCPSTSLLAQQGGGHVCTEAVSADAQTRCPSSTAILGLFVIWKGLAANRPDHILYLSFLCNSFSFWLWARCAKSHLSLELYSTYSCAGYVPVSMFIKQNIWERAALWREKGCPGDNEWFTPVDPKLISTRYSYFILWPVCCITKFTLYNRAVPWHTKLFSSYFSCWCWKSQRMKAEPTVILISQMHQKCQNKTWGLTYDNLETP